MSEFQISSCKLQIGSWLARVAVAVVALTSSAVAFAQSCPACYANAASRTPGMLQALKTGILVMMFPSLSMFIVIFAVVYRRRESFNEGKAEIDLNPAIGANRQWTRRLPPPRRSG
jgi:ABC-type maltose transport system permease subunit